MERQDMMDYLKARGIFERAMNQLVNWELAELVEKAMDAGVPTLDESKEIEELTEAPKEQPKEELKEEKPKAKPKSKPKAKPKAKKAKKE